MHRRRTNKRDIKAQFYAVRRFESKQVPFVSGGSKSSLFITQDSTCLPEGSSLYDGGEAAGRIILFGCCETDEEEEDGDEPSRESQREKEGGTHAKTERGCSKT